MKPVKPFLEKCKCQAVGCKNPAVCRIFGSKVCRNHYFIYLSAAREKRQIKKEEEKEL